MLRERTRNGLGAARKEGRIGGINDLNILHGYLLRGLTFLYRLPGIGVIREYWTGGGQSYHKSQREYFLVPRHLNVMWHRSVFRNANQGGTYPHRGLRWVFNMNETAGVSEATEAELTDNTAPPHHPESSA